MRITPFKIPKTGNNAVIVQEDIEEQFYDKFHQHEELQISLVLKGSGTLLVGDSIKRYGPGDVVVFGSYLPHVFKSDINGQDKSHMVSIFFTKENFGEQLFQINELKSLETLLSMATSGFKIKRPNPLMTKYFLNLRDCVGLDRLIQFFGLLALLDHEEKILLSSTAYKTRLKDNEGQRIAKVFDYMVSHFQDKISLGEIADVASMTPTAFCRFFKLHTRKTFSQFLLELRIEHACKLLETQGHKVMVSDIAFRSGFSSISNFNRYFKKTKGMSPLNYAASKLQNH
ncbi:helix-turn-helix domain-containing protein [Muricauda sp. JGD-17]|uniref:Helix-turn-helix domain-containing protein n=1 Tax=Flagellimonas ochracea TaxID=2696472 RepID=A0A964TFJ4_9FLAO|nr:AraC family transcriptional regulator [Allomuricauda ochracea]NAY92851.1 helix-turn-helix domain-containing protein [Allomuricauda ochracea]